QVVTLTPTGPGGSGESDPSSGGGYGTAVASRAAAVLADMPPRFDVDAAMAALSLQGGLSVPLNLVMFQEVQQLNIVIDTVSQQLHQVQLAVRGEFPMSDTLAATGVQLERGAVPAWWITAPSGDEISWRATSLSTWCDGLTKRAHELSAYLARGRPTSFWLTGLLNPRAFITAMKQEVCRTQGGASPLFGKGAGRPSQRAAAGTGENWALDKLELVTAVQGVLDPEHISFRMVPGEGVLVHGLTLQGACWSVRGGSLTEAPHGTLWSPLPVLKLTACPPGTARKEGGAGRSGVSGGQFACPCYVYKTRTAERLVFVATLPSGLQRPEHWVLRGVALLCNTDV
ncbi:Dnah8, partial [Symbiodinium sp. KB8]